MKRILLVVVISLVISAGLLAGLSGVVDAYDDPLDGYDHQSELICNNLCDGYDSTSTTLSSELLSHHYGDFNRDTGCKEVQLQFERAWTVVDSSETISEVNFSISWDATKSQNSACDGRSSSLDNHCVVYSSDSISESVWGSGTTIGPWYDQDDTGTEQYNVDVPDTSKSVRVKCILSQGWLGHLDMVADLELIRDECEPVTDVSLNLQDGYIDFSGDVITVSAGVPLGFDLDYLPVDATEVVTEYVDAAGGTEGFVPGSPEGHWEAGWATPGTYTLTYAVANCDGTSDLGDTSTPCYPGHQWKQATVSVISQCTPLEGIWLNSTWSGTEPKGGEGQTEFYAEVGEVWEGEITYLPLDATRDSIQHPGEFDKAISVSGVPSNVTAHMNFSQYDELNFSLRPDITGTLYITYALANCSEYAGWDYEPYPGYQWLTATLHITDSVPITYLIPITQPTAPTMDCTYCLRPSEVCSEGTSICILTSWIDWQICLQRCWFDFGLDWSIYVFQLFQWWSVELVNFHYAWLRYFWMSAMMQYEEIYSKWAAIQTLVSAYYHNYASFIQSLSVWINISSGNIISSFDEIAAFLAGKIAQMAPLISAWSTEVSDWINAVKDALSAWSSDTFDKLGGFLKNFVLFLRIIYLFIRMSTASGLEKLRIAWKLAKLSAQLMSNRLLGPFRSVIKSIRQMAELAGELGSGAKAAINSDTKADLFNYGTNFSDPGVQQIGGMEAMAAESEGGLSYALDGLQFFEDLAGSSPLNYVSYIAIGILALRLTMWTLAKARDLMEDLRHF